MTITLKIRDYYASFEMLKVPKTLRSNQHSDSERAGLLGRKKQAELDLAKASQAVKKISFVANIQIDTEEQSKPQERDWSPVLALENQNRFPEFFKNLAKKEQQDFAERKRIGLGISYALYRFRQEPIERSDSPSLVHSSAADTDTDSMSASRPSSPTSSEEVVTDDSMSSDSE